ncbi:hypothetical protein BEWA_005210 [Theileria equi strain WA]|uniref:Thioredoxin domain-containing protein n=1 Tax=Theileria equi strain WA TaxID=1537102 RepID=L0B0R9_THEEQ|nr:hypothetical protein BEWA_005210 [Theileria equi strain WA]AFZ81113.1 hypothetical protein BEWA_005210 [Theileria equi strain WA]|eukprot:XP_004830779.1 hypothetical protein BEWA_005210 [Theileria equi strain WA]
MIPLIYFISTLSIATYIGRNVHCLKKFQDADRGDDRLNVDLPTLSESHIKDLSTNDISNLFKEIPHVDHVVLFYITLNSNCRNFMNIYNTLAQQCGSENKAINFVKFNCQGATKKFELCHEYNIKTVPTVAYISSHIIQRNYMPVKSLLRRVLKYLLFTSRSDDISLPNATCYKGDLFVYEELRDWVSIMYNLSYINRKMRSMTSLRQIIFYLWSKVTQFF